MRSVYVAYGRKMLSLLARRLEVSMFELTERCRRKDVVAYRHVCVWWLRKNTTLSFPEIGALMGFDHATMVYAYRNIEDKLSVKDDIIMYLVKRLNNEV